MLDDLNDLIETKWASLGPRGQPHFKGRYEFVKSLLRKRIAVLAAKEKEPTPRPTAKDKRCAADTLAEAKRRERGEILLKLAGEFGESLVESVIADLQIDWHVVSDKWVTVVRLICRHGKDRVNHEAESRFGAPPRYLESPQIAQIEAALNDSLRPVPERV